MDAVHIETTTAPRNRIVVCLIAAGTYYAVLLTVGGGLFGPVPHGLVFNSMLTHLLHGRFDVDPAAIGDEGYLRDGLTYAYFGIVPALFRLPFLLSANFADVDFTRIGCLVAVAAMASFKAMTVSVVARAAGSHRAPLLPAILLATVLVGGAQVEFLRPSIFQEAALWASAAAAAFVYLFIRGWLGQSGFGLGSLSAMAAIAGLCLLTRVSTALGLYIALGLLWLVLAWRLWRNGSGTVALARFALPLLIAFGFAAITAGINQARWGNPLVFADLSRALILDRFPDRLVRLREYGEFNLVRLPFGLVYYLFPLWVLRDGGGELWWGAFQARAIDAVELPPASFLVTDPLLIGLAAYGIVQLLRRSRGPDWALAWPVLTGFAVPIGLMLIAIDMSFRYRLEFYPFLELAAFAGYLRLVTTAGARGRWLACVAGLWSIVAAQAMWVLYMMSPFGPADGVMNGLDIVGFYGSLLH